MTSSHTNSASIYFNENWLRYQSTLQHNTLYHREMLLALKHFLVEHFSSRPFSFVDVGCGDGSTVTPVLAETTINHYIGIDAAADVLTLAENTLTPIHCKKEFIADNMETAIPQLTLSVDIIYTSYAVHHLSLQDKIKFIEHCQHTLNPGGFLLMVDVIREPEQTHDAWVAALKARMHESMPELASEELDIRIQHPRTSDFPETIETFTNIAQQQSWRDFQIIVNKGMFAFMVFTKGD